ncbi:Glu-tRNA(Gln) amidotransferase subunit GatE [Candidatus Dependentiae bacterium]|nr:Glu-tRNA(Gln) amidotransferase subunit GatE [Candidatus Dependentiae bacterium]
MDNLDFNDSKYYSKLGFMSGLEVHQQLLTDKKLFCHCPIEYQYHEPNARILRHMRPTLSEMGTYDGTALMEFKTKKNVIYNLFTEVNCTYEMDDTPPFLINSEALDITIEICFLFNCALTDEIHVVRKQYLDGSIPTGFQRTLILGLAGWIPYKGRKIRIRQISLEEDSCRQISDHGHTINFKGDRLGIPLVEVVTEPDMKTPTEVMEVADLIGSILRASGKVRTGLGSTRQDVNVSVPGGTRIEIKGVSRLKYIPALTHYETLRQIKLLELKKEFQIRGINKDTLKTEIRKLTSFLKKEKTKNQWFKQALKSKHEIKGILLKGIGGIFNQEVQPGFTFGDEVSGRVRVVACIDELPNILHTDMDSAELNIEPEELVKIKKLFGFKTPDILVFTRGENEDVEMALGEIKLRVLDAIDGVPPETRQAFPNGFTDFERILPGPDRMYPDTDHPPQQLKKERMKKIKKAIKNRYVDQYKKLKDSFKIPEEYLKKFILSDRSILIQSLIKKKVKPEHINFILFEIFTYLRRKGYSASKFTDQELEDLFSRIQSNTIHISEVRKLLQESFEKQISLNEIIKNYKNAKSLDDLKKEIKKLFKSSKSKNINFILGELRKTFPETILYAKALNKFIESQVG